MRHASLFSGIGGPEIAAAMMGWDNVFHCEINPFGRQILNYWFPNSNSYEDITKTDFKQYRGSIDVLTGGFPCQPFSYAGKRKGHADDRYLWPEMLRAIDEIRPTWVIGENVAGITTMVEPGETTHLESTAPLFEANRGVHRFRTEHTFTIERICRDLEQIGYTVQPLLVPACAVGAPHRRDRVFIIASIIADSDRGNDLREPGEHEGKSRKKRISEWNEVRKPGEPSDVRSEGEESAENSMRDGLFSRLAEKQRDKRNEWNTCSRDNEWICGEERLDFTDSDLQRCNESMPTQEPRKKERFACEENIKGGIRSLHPKERWAFFPTISPVYRGNDGLPFNVDDLTIPFSKWRNESIKAYGNTIVPQVMYRIFQCIEQLNR